MKLYVLDENGHVIFEFENRDGDYKSRPSNSLQIAVMTLVRAALLYLSNHFILHRD